MIFFYSWIKIIESLFSLEIWLYLKEFQRKISRAKGREARAKNKENLETNIHILKESIPNEESMDLLESNSQQNNLIITIANEASPLINNEDNLEIYPEKDTTIDDESAINILAKLNTELPVNTKKRKPKEVFFFSFLFLFLHTDQHIYSFLSSSYMFVLALHSCVT